MTPHQERVVQEKEELDDKINKLNIFLTTDTFKTIPPDEQSRLKDQSNIMAQYSHVLGLRIQHFQ